MLAVLPRRSADELSGELFVAAYEQQLANYPAPAIEYLRDEAIRTQRWFPPVVDCHEMIEGWRRNDAATARRSLAGAIATDERRQRRLDAENERSDMIRVEMLTQSNIDAMPESLRAIGLRSGFLVQDDDGTVRPA